jgi:hypothetical protein
LAGCRPIHLSRPGSKKSDLSIEDDCSVCYVPRTRVGPRKLKLVHGKSSTAKVHAVCPGTWIHKLRCNSVSIRNAAWCPPRRISPITAHCTTEHRRIREREGIDADDRTVGVVVRQIVSKSNAAIGRAAQPRNRQSELSPGRRIPTWRSAPVHGPGINIQELSSEISPWICCGRTNVYGARTNLAFPNLKLVWKLGVRWAGLGVKRNHTPIL